MSILAHEPSNLNSIFDLNSKVGEKGGRQSRTGNLIKTSLFRTVFEKNWTFILGCSLKQRNKINTFLKERSSQKESKQSRSKKRVFDRSELKPSKLFCYFIDMFKSAKREVILLAELWCIPIWKS